MTSVESAAAMTARRPRPPSVGAPGGRRRWRLRRASGSDWKVLVDHRHRMFAELGGRTPRQLAVHDGLYKRRMLPRLNSGELVELLIEAPGTGVVASGGIWFRPEQPRPEAAQLDIPYLLSMYTEPEFRGQGLAGRIVREAVRICRAQGYGRVVLHAAPPGRRLYRRAGFERTWEMRLALRR